MNKSNHRAGISLFVTKVACLWCLSTLSYGSMQVSFVESAPKDRFSFTNIGECVLQDVRVSIDLNESEGKLIFDTTANGAGVEVFQPFQVRSGDIQLVSGEAVYDGDRLLTVNIKRIQPGDSVSFTIDVDDTTPEGELGMIRVSGSEMENSRAIVTMGNTLLASGAFDKNSIANVYFPSCEA